MEVQFLSSAQCLVMVLYLNKFHENIFDGSKVIEGTRFFMKKNQRGIIPKKKVE